MLQLIDNTLMALKDDMPSKEDLHKFCELLFIIGVDVIELPLKIYERMGLLPPGKFALNVEFSEDIMKNPGFYRYICHQGAVADNVIHEIQINDIREIIRLRTWRSNAEVRIVGLDDLMCHSYEKLMNEIVSNLPFTIVHFCPENSYGCASALALQWVLDYGMNITTSFAGCKNNAATEEVIMALRLAIRHKPNRDLTVLPQLTKLYEEFLHKSVGNRKPIIGNNIFKVEAGIHADGLCKNPATYEAYSPISVGKKSELVIGKHSGTKAVKMKMAELKLPSPSEIVVDKVLQSVRIICTQHRKSMEEKEFVKLVMEVMKSERDKIYC